MSQNACFPEKCEIDVQIDRDFSCFCNGQTSNKLIPTDKKWACRVVSCRGSFWKPKGSANTTGTVGQSPFWENAVNGRFKKTLFKEILEGMHDALPEQAFYMSGTIDEVVIEAERLGAIV